MPGTDTSSEVRAIILQLAKSNSLSQTDIASTVRRHPSTVSKIISRYKISGDLSSSPRSSRPPKVSPRDKRQLVRTCIRDRFLSATQILDKASLSSSISPSRANQLLGMEGLSARWPRKKPYLSPKHRRGRLTWAMQHKDWDLEKWQTCIFGDESTFETGKPDGSILVRRRPGEAHNPECLRPTFKSGRTTSNHWGGIHFAGRSELQCLRGEGRLTAAKYVEHILHGGLQRFYQDIKDRTGEAPIIMEDNATCHTKGVAGKASERYFFPSPFPPKFKFK